MKEGLIYTSSIPNQYQRIIIVMRSAAQCIMGAAALRWIRRKLISSSRDQLTGEEEEERCFLFSASILFQVEDYKYLNIRSEPIREQDDVMHTAYTYTYIYCVYIYIHIYVYEVLHIIES